MFEHKGETRKEGERSQIEMSPIFYLSGIPVYGPYKGGRTTGQISDSQPQARAISGNPDKSRESPVF